MLFLFNDVVFDLGDLNGVLRSGQIPLTLEQIETLTAAQLNGLVREAIFADPNIARTKPDHVRHLVALISFVAPGANALLAVRPEGAEVPAEVGLRYANVMLTTLASLWKDQQLGYLPPGQINDQVWLAA